MIFNTILLGTGFYATIASYNMYKKYKSLEYPNHNPNITKLDNITGILIENIKTEYNQPTGFIINYGHSGVYVPIGNSNPVDKTEFLTSSFYHRETFIKDYECLEPYTSLTYINSMEELDKIFNVYKIDKEKYLIRLPLKKFNYCIDKPAYACYIDGNGVISTDISKARKYLVLKTRFPLTYMSIISFCLMTGYKIMEKNEN